MPGNEVNRRWLEKMWEYPCINCHAVPGQKCHHLGGEVWQDKRKVWTWGKIEWDQAVHYDRTIWPVHRVVARIMAQPGAITTFPTLSSTPAPPAEPDKDSSVSVGDGTLGS